MMVNVQIGDLFNSGAETLVNTINCVGIMGKGIAQEFKKRYPAMFDDYVKRCKANTIKLGQPYHYQDNSGVNIINFATKQHWRSPAKLEDIIAGLDYFIRHHQEWNIKSIAFPPLGCGNGGLAWETVGPIMFQKLSQLNISVDIYAPFGTKSQYLTREFLNTRSTKNKNTLTGKKHQKLKAEWISIIEVIDQLQNQRYTNPVGRTIFQKICYIMTEQGIKTGFKFNQGSYGPFSNDIQDALVVLANTNLVREEQLGKMTALRSGSEYQNIKQKYAGELESAKTKIEKTVDLFSRIKNTEQAEEATTVLFTIKNLKNQNPNHEVTEQEVFDSVFNWKKSWNAIPDKKQIIASAIRELQMLNWATLKHSPELPYQDDLI